ncbi:MAG: hypothetical protein A2171_00315 [Candidatus Levybacteria bacterium RBG_13_35_9]|nr:MAG: hypothetical protein A2171_00315 [Candidatus Levybacteria bacterium RBG_13_35_9]
MKQSNDYREKYAHDIYFDKKWREKAKKSFLRIQKEILEKSDFTVKPVLKEEYEQRNLERAALELSVVGLAGIKKAEEFYKKTYLTKCTFTLFKKGKTLVFKNRFYKPLLNVWKISYFLLPTGIPEKKRKKVFIIRDKFSLTGFKTLEKGSFRQKVYEIDKMYLFFKSSKKRWKFDMKLISSEKNSYWATIAPKSNY